MKSRTVMTLIQSLCRRGFGDDFLWYEDSEGNLHQIVRVEGRLRRGVILHSTPSDS